MHQNFRVAIHLIGGCNQSKPISLVAGSRCRPGGPPASRCCILAAQLPGNGTYIAAPLAQFQASASTTAASRHIVVKQTKSALPPDMLG
jgi:hypothetical protein